MAEVTVIAPNVVEFVGNFARQSEATAERAFPPPPPPRTETPLKTRQDAGERSGNAAANRNTPLPPPATPKTTSPGGFNPLTDPKRRPSQPSAQFLAQRIAQETFGPSRPAQPLSAAVGAYEKLRGPQNRNRDEPLILTRSVDRSV